MTQERHLPTIYDRKAFLDILARQTEHAVNFETKLGLLIVDIDRFHKVNRTFSYAVGDEILKKFGQLLRSAVRAQDYVGKIGDNRFGIILNGIMNTGHAELAAHKILRLLETPFSVNHQKVPIDCTIAISICPLHTSNHFSLLNQCEALILEARQRHENLGISELPEEETLSENWDIELALEDALELDQLLIHYQPKVSLRTGRVEGAEALLRWKHPHKGFISPGYFIPIAENMGHMKQITNWVINTALRQSAEWSDQWGALHVSVNVPPDLLLAPDFKDQVANALHLWADHNIKLTIEIIERSLVTEPARAISLLEDLQSMGVLISIDDFGTGYSSLSYFEKLPANELKIDQSFIHNVEENQHNRSIVKLIVDLAHAFDMQVVAEGVESMETLRYLKDIGCDTIQGYYLAKPMPHQEVRKWMSTFSWPEE